MRISNLVVVLVVLFGCPLFAQVKVGFVDLQKALMTVEEGKQAKAKLEKQVQAKQKEFDKMQDDLKKMKDELEQQGAMMREDLRRQKIQDYQKKLMELQDYYLNNQREIQEAEAKALKPIFERFDRILKKIGKEGGYTIIFEKAAVVYADPGVDLTDRLIKEFNQGAEK